MNREYLTPTLEILLMSGNILTSSPEVDPGVKEDEGELPWQDW